MKKSIFLIAGFLVLSITVFGQIRMDSQGQVRIGAAADPRHGFDVDTDAYFSCLPALAGFYFENYGNAAIILPQWNHSMYLGRSDRELWRIYTEYISVQGVWLTSDKKLKENIRPLTGSLNNLSKLKAVKFDFKADLYNDSLDYRKDELKAKRKDHSGFIAQEVQKIYPKLVDHNKDADRLEINYLGFIPELVEAIQEQQMVIESLKSEIQELKKTDNNLKSANSTLGTSTLQISEDNSLYQNYPNPFSENTKIEYSLNEDVQKAMINIYDMNGTQLKSIPLHLRGYNNITVNGGEFKAGMYMYSLIADGKIIDTKRMILTN